MNNIKEILRDLIHLSIPVAVTFLATKLYERFGLSSTLAVIFAYLFCQQLNRNSQLEEKRVLDIREFSKDFKDLAEKINSTLDLVIKAVTKEK